jgi:hypothetical protein
MGIPLATHRRETMQLTLTDQEAQALVDAIKTRLDQLQSSFAKADSLKFKEGIVAQRDTLEAIYKRLGCEYPGWAETPACEV